MCGSSHPPVLYAPGNVIRASKDLQTLDKWRFSAALLPFGGLRGLYHFELNIE
jgi:hypothetical protein